MGNCKICGQPKHVFMQNKFVCTQCDELLFDMEIELDGPTPKFTAPTTANRPAKVLRLADKKLADKKSALDKSTQKETEADPFEDDQDLKSKKAA